MPSSLGTLAQNAQLYDGLACNDKNMIYTFSTTNSYIGYNLTALKDDLYEATVEFWLRRQLPTTALTYYFSLYSNNLKAVYMNIYKRLNHSEIICNVVNNT